MKRPEEQRLEHIIRLMQTDSSVDAPADTLRYAKNLFRTRAAEPKVSVFERIVAVIQVDLAPGRAAFGERSGSQGQARQMLFQSGDNAIDLRISATKAGFEIRGQILGGGFENSQIKIAGTHSSVSTTANELSEFELSAVPAGDHNLTIQGTSAEIYIEQISLR